MATAIAGVIVIILAFVLRAKVTSTDAPSGIQLLWETITIQMRDQVESAIGMKVAPFVPPGGRLVHLHPGGQLAVRAAGDVVGRARRDP